MNDDEMVSKPVVDASLTAHGSSSSRSNSSHMNPFMESPNKDDSILMRSILLANNMTTNVFLETIWQQRPCVFPFKGGGRASASTTILRQQAGSSSSGEGKGGDGSWNDDAMQESPLEEIVWNGWHIVTKLLHDAQQQNSNRKPLQQQQQQQDEEESPRVAKVARRNGGNDTTNTIDARTNSSSSNDINMSLEEEQELLAPLIFHNRELQHPTKIQALYGSSLFAPYLDGCSIVINHGDLQSPWIAAICNDLQRLFPHAYANCYLTPPHAQAVPPHADDRDVLVIQLVGSKTWQVYQTVPIPYPYPHEQVGKEGLAVPASVLEGPTEISTTLHPGDVLYMPRGFVHQAQCHAEPSFHITVALATHDWTLAGLVSAATEQTLTRVVEFRQAIVPTMPRGSSSSHGDGGALQTKIDAAFTMLREQITAEALLKRLEDKLDSHNRRAFSIRMNLIHAARFPPSHTTATVPPGDIIIVGPHAALRTTFTTIVRGATADEKASVVAATSTTSDQPRGLNVREENADAIMDLIARFKQDSTLTCRVLDLKSLIIPSCEALLLPKSPNSHICELTLLCLAKRCVELGAWAIVL